MKDVTLIKTLVLSYYEENNNVEQIEDFLKESLNIEIHNVQIEDFYLIIYYGPKKDKITFEIFNNKIKVKKDKDTANG
jgi:hypothetical protein